MHHQLRTHRNHEVTNLLLLAALLLHDLDVRMELLFTILDDHPLPQSGELVQLLAHRLVLDDVGKPDDARDVGDDRRGVRIPREHHLVALDLLTILHHQHGAERYLQSRQHGRCRIVGRANGNLAFVRCDDARALCIGDVHESFAVLERSSNLALARRLLGDTRRRSTNVECTQRQLRPRLADRLRGKNSYRFTLIHDLHRRRVAPVAHAAEPALCLTGEHRANPYRLDPRILDRARLFLVDQFTGFDEQRRPAGLVELVRILDVLRRHVADDTLRQRLDDVLAFLQRTDLESENGAAVLFSDRDILRHVHQTARQVSGVGRLERRVGQTLTSTVRRDEVLEHRQSFTEVRLDRALDDLANTTGQLLLRLGHQAAHSGQLPDLVARPSRARIEHHEDRIVAVLRPGHRLHHGVGDVVVRVRPRIDDLVVPLAVRDVAGLIGTLEPLYPRLGFLQKRELLRRDLEILDADRDTAHCGVAEAVLLEPVEEDHRVLETGPAIALEHQLGERLLLHVPVLEADTRRDDGVEQRAADGGHFPPLALFVIDEVLDRRTVGHLT